MAIEHTFAFQMDGASLDDVVRIIARDFAEGHFTLWENQTAYPDDRVMHSKTQELFIIEQSAYLPQLEGRRLAYELAIVDHGYGFMPDFRITFRPKNVAFGDAQLETVLILNALLKRCSGGAVYGIDWVIPLLWLSDGVLRLSNDGNPWGKGDHYLPPLFDLPHVMEDRLTIDLPDGF